MLIVRIDQARPGLPAIFSDGMVLKGGALESEPARSLGAVAESAVKEAG